MSRFLLLSVEVTEGEATTWGHHWRVVMEWRIWVEVVFIYHNWGVDIPDSILNTALGELVGLLDATRTSMVHGYNPLHQEGIVIENRFHEVLC